MKIVLFGKDGQVGEAIRRACPVGWDLVCYGRREAPLDDLQRIRQLLTTEMPDVIINAAAYTAVDRAETEPELAGLINRDAPALMARTARETGAWLIHYSSDYVYDGKKTIPYVESDPPNPLGIYGRTKLDGDLAIAASACHSLIFRVSWVYAFGHRNFPQAILDLARERSSLNVVGDQIGAPTDAAFIAAVTMMALKKLAREREAEQLGGLYHLSPAGDVSRAELARFLVAEARAAGAELALDPVDIRDISTMDYPQPAARPLNSRLDSTRISQVLSFETPDWREAMRAWIANAIRGDARES